MPKKQKRDNAYYEQRLKAEYPGIYGDFLADRIQSLRQALLIAGLQPERTRVQKLKNSWKKATADERDDFLKWLGETGALSPASTQTTAATRSPDPAPFEKPIASGRYLLPSTIARIKAIMVERRLSAGEVMVEMGFVPDQSLTRALLRNASLRLTVIAALEEWLGANAGDF